MKGICHDAGASMHTNHPEGVFNTSALLNVYQKSGAACVSPCAGKFLSDAIREADTDRDGRVSIDEFTTYYERLARWAQHSSTRFALFKVVTGPCPTSLSCGIMHCMFTSCTPIAASGWPTCC
jgi:hypothetical protein